MRFGDYNLVERSKYRDKLFKKHMASKLWGKLGESVSTDLEAEFPGLDLDLYDTNAGYILSKIALPKEERGFGIGTQVMRRLIDIADSEGKMIALTPDTTFGGSKSRLIQFYKRFGFVPNKGRNKTFDFRETMVRYPRSNENVNEIRSMTGYPKGKVTYWNHDEEKLKKVGKLGDYNIHKSIESEADGGDHVFVIKKDETPLGELILTQRDSPFAQAKKQGFWTSSVHFDPKIQGKGLAVPLYAYAVKKGYDIVSDDNQSKGSEILWQKLSKKPGINVYAWDRENNKFFAYDPEEDPRGQVYSDDDLKQKLIDEYLEMMRKANSQEEKDELDKELKKELADITPDGYDTRLVAVSKTKKTQETLEEALSDISKSSKVCVDMDGVLADFFGSWKKLVGKDWREIDTKDIPAALQKIRDTKDFWLKIPPTPNASKLLGLIKKLKGSYNILSAPLPDDPNSEPHKRAWIEKYLKVFPPSRVIITHDKAKYATQSDGTPNILIDDFGQNIAKWEAAGGVGFKHKDHKFERTVKSLKQNIDDVNKSVKENFADGKKKTEDVNEDIDVSTQRGRLAYYLKQPDIKKGMAIHLGRLPKYHDGKDELADMVPDRVGVFALHPDAWESTFYSLTNKDFKSITRYKPAIVKIPPNSIVGDMAIANKFYRTNDADEKQTHAEAYRDSIVPYGSDTSHMKMPEIIMPRLIESASVGIVTKQNATKDVSLVC